MRGAAPTGAAVHDCVLLSTADWDAPYWTNKQHMARTMAARGWRVLYVESPGLRRPRAGSSRDWRRLWLRLRRGVRGLLAGPTAAEPGIWVLSPLSLPGGGARWVEWLNAALLSWTLGRFTRRQRFVAPLLWTYHPFTGGAETARGGALVYHCVDDLGAIPGVDAERFAIAEEALLRRCDAVFATSRPLAKKCAAINANTHYLSNVVDARHFGLALQPGPLPGDLATIPTPRLVYHGVISDFKLDLDLLHDVADRHPEWHVVLIGEEREGQHADGVARLRQLPNVHWLGYRDYARLPEYLRGMDVGLLPSALNEYTQAMFPMKFFEYLAAGLPVASTPSAFTEEHFAHLAIGGDSATFAAAITEQLARGRLTPTQAAVAVGDHTWDGRMDKIEQVLAGLGSPRSLSGDRS